LNELQMSMQQCSSEVDQMHATMKTQQDEVVQLRTCLNEHEKEHKAQIVIMKGDARKMNDVTRHLRKTEDDCIQAQKTLQQ